MARGGKRKGAGRPKNTGKFKELTKAVRIPVSMIDQIMEFIRKKGLTYPIYSQNTAKKQSIFPNEEPAKKFDLAGFLVPNPEMTFLVKVGDNTMKKAGIYNGDFLIVDKSLQPGNGHVVVVNKDHSFLVRRLVIDRKKIQLRSEGEKTAILNASDMGDLNIIGVVRHVIHHV